MTEMAKCPSCNGYGWHGPVDISEGPERCDTCDGAGKITLTQLAAWEED